MADRFRDGVSTELPFFHQNVLEQHQPCKTLRAALRNSAFHSKICAAEHGPTIQPALEASAVTANPSHRDAPYCLVPHDALFWPRIPFQIHFLSSLQHPPTSAPWSSSLRLLLSSLLIIPLVVASSTTIGQAG